jgi:hypothetical protein
VESSCERSNEPSFGFHIILGNYRVAAKLLASRVALSSKELVNYISMSGFALLRVTNMSILMISYDFCLLPSVLLHSRIHRKVESCVQIVDRRELWKFANRVSL